MSIVPDIKCVIFDLDDTLYPQIEFDKGCLKNSAGYISDLCGRSQAEISHILMKIINSKGIEYRKIFNDLFEIINFDGMKYIDNILRYYWAATPNISLFPNTKYILDYLKRNYLLAMITDGYVNIQKYKIKTLGISDYFSKIYFTDYYGVENRKPSRYVFDIFLNEIGLSPQKCVYVGNDPRRDFIPARATGMHSIRIRQGSLSKMTLSEEYEAEYTVDDISQLTKLI